MRLEEEEEEEEDTSKSRSKEDSASSSIHSHVSGGAGRPPPITPLPASSVARSCESWSREARRSVSSKSSKSSAGGGGGAAAGDGKRFPPNSPIRACMLGLSAGGRASEWPVEVPMGAGGGLGATACVYAEAPLWPGTVANSKRHLTKPG